MKLSYLNYRGDIINELSAKEARVKIHLNAQAYTQAAATYTNLLRAFPKVDMPMSILSMVGHLVLLKEKRHLNIEKWLIGVVMR